MTHHLRTSIIHVLIMMFLAASVTAGPQNAGWKTKTALGLNLTSGNSDTTLINADLNISKKTPVNEFQIGATLAYGEIDNETTEKNGKACAQYNRLLTDKTYFYANCEAAYDDIAMIDYRLIAGPGAGYYILKNKHHTLRIEIGVSYLNKKIRLDAADDDDPGSDSTETSDTIAFRVSQRYEGAISKTANVLESIEYLPDAADWDIYLLNAELAVETTINARFSLRIAFQDRYDSDPAPGVEKNDAVVKAAFVYTL